MDNDECAKLWDAAVRAGTDAVLNSGGRSIFVHHLRTGVIEKISEDVRGHCRIILEGKHDFSRWLVRNGIGKRYPRGCVTIEDKSGTYLAVASELCARAIAVVLYESDVPIIRIDP